MKVEYGIRSHDVQMDGNGVVTGIDTDPRDYDEKPYNKRTAIFRLPPGSHISFECKANGTGCLLQAANEKKKVTAHCSSEYGNTRSER